METTTSFVVTFSCPQCNFSQRYGGNEPQEINLPPYCQACGHLEQPQVIKTEQFICQKTPPPLTNKL